MYHTTGMTSSLVTLLHGKYTITALIFIFSTLFHSINTAATGTPAVTTFAPLDTDQLPLIDKLLEGSDNDKAQAKSQLAALINKYPRESEVLWRMSRSCHALGQIEGAKGNTNKKKELILEGLEYATRALKYGQNSANSHKWYAICIGARGQLGGTKEKIEDGIIFKKHIEKAISINDTDPKLHNLLARFEFEVATLSFFERRIAGWLFAEVPQGTVENAIKGFLKSEQLNPKPWKENRLLLAKCYIYQEEYSRAVNWLEKALAVPAANSEEKKFDEEIRSLLKKYESYK